MGLVARQIGGFDRVEAQRLLKIPEGFEPATLLSVGYFGGAGESDRRAGGTRQSGATNALDPGRVRVLREVGESVRVASLVAIRRPPPEGRSNPLTRVGCNGLHQLHAEQIASFYAGFAGIASHLRSVVLVGDSCSVVIGTLSWQFVGNFLSVDAI